MRKIVCITFLVLGSLAVSGQASVARVLSIEEMLDRGKKFGGGDLRRFLNCGQRPSNLDQFVCRVGASAYAASSGFYEATKTRVADTAHYFAAFASLEAMSMIQTVLSGAREAMGHHAVRMRLQDRPEPSSTIEECLANWIGICGNHVDLFMHVMQNMNIPARVLQFAYHWNDPTASDPRKILRATHIAVEVFYAGDWRFLDVSNGAVFPTEKPLMLMSYADIKRTGARKPRTNGNNVWFEFRELVGVDSFDYLHSSFAVITDYAGVVTLQPRLESSHYIERFEHLWGFIGDNKADGKSGGIVYRIELTGRHRVRLELDGVGCVDTPGSRIRVGEAAIPVTTPIIETEVVGTFDIHVESEQDVCYVGLKQLTISRLH